MNDLTVATVETSWRKNNVPSDQTDCSRTPVRKFSTVNRARIAATVANKISAATVNLIWIY